MDTDPPDVKHSVFNWVVKHYDSDDADDYFWYYVTNSDDPKVNMMKNLMII